MLSGGKGVSTNDAILSRLRGLVCNLLAIKKPCHTLNAKPAG